MTEIEKFSIQYSEKEYPEDMEGDRSIACLGFQSGFIKSRSMIIEELKNIAAQTDDSKVIALAVHFEKFGEKEVKE